MGRESKTDTGGYRLVKVLVTYTVKVLSTGTSNRIMSCLMHRDG